MLVKKALSILLSVCVLVGIGSNSFLAFELSTDEEITACDAQVKTLKATDVSKDCQILQYVDKDSFENINHIVRLPKEEDLNTYVFANSDGTRSVYYLDENVKFLAEDGTVKEKDITLIDNKDGYGIAESDIVLDIPKDISNGIEMSFSEHSIKLTPQVNFSNEIEVQKKDNSIMYSNVFGKGISLKYTPVLSGIKEDIILSSYTDMNTFTFRLETDGLYLYEDAENYFLAEEETSDLKFDLGSIIVYDAIGKPTTGTLSSTTVIEGNEYILTISVDETFLSDSTTVYPVTIDPTLIVAETTSNPESIIDSTIFSGFPNNNYGNYAYLSLGYINDTYKIGRTMVSLPGVYNSDIYNNMSAGQIISVKFYCQDSSGNDEQYVKLYANNSAAWTESSVTWNNAGTYSTNEIWGENVASSGWTLFDITSLVKAWKHGTYSPRAGFRLINYREAPSGYEKILYSSEHPTSSYQPYVVLTYSYDVAGIEDGTSYYITNCYSGRMLSLSTNSTAAGTNVSTLIKSNSNTRKWTLERQSTGGYKIFSVYASNKILNVSNNNINIGADSSSMKFVVKRLDTGTYTGLYLIKYNGKYVSQDSDYNVCLTSSLLGDKSYWSFSTVEKHDATLFNIKYPKSNGEMFDSTSNNSYFNTVTSTLGYSSFIYTNERPYKAYSRLKNKASFFVYIGHGKEGLLQFYNSTGDIYGIIAPNSKVSLGYSEQYYIDNMDLNALAGAKCVLYLGCLTGNDYWYYSQTYRQLYSLVKSTYNKGAHFVLGVTEYAVKENTENFLKGFLDGVNNGESIYECIEDGLFESGPMCLVDENGFPKKDANGNEIILSQFPITYMGDGVQSLEY